MCEICLPTMEFPMDRIKAKKIFTDSTLMESLSLGREHACLPKVEEALYKLVMPVGKQYPYVFSSIAFSADGKFAYPDNTDGDMLVHSHSLNPDGGVSDYFVLNMLRAYSDAVMIGTKTMTAEANAFPTILDPELVAQRNKYLGKKQEQPFPIVVSKDGTDIPFHHILFHQPLIPVVIFTSLEGLENLKNRLGDGFYHMEHFSAEELYRRTGECAILAMGQNGVPDLEAFLLSLKAGGVDHILNESPTLMWLLMKQNLLNEFFITYAMVFIGGKFAMGFDSPATYQEHPQSQLAAVSIHKNTFLFTRQLLQAAR